MSFSNIVSFIVACLPENENILSTDRKYFYIIFQLFLIETLPILEIFILHFPLHFSDNVISLIIKNTLQYIISIFWLYIYAFILYIVLWTFYSYNSINM